MENKKTISEIFESMTDEQKNAVYLIVGQALEENRRQNADYTETPDMSLLPGEIRCLPGFENAMNELENAFYDMLNHGLDECIGSLTGNDSLNSVFRTLILNSCKESFNKAYIRCLMNGG